MAQEVCKLSMPIYFAFSPEEAAHAAASAHPLACMGYQLSSDTPALLAPDPLPASACHMVLQDNIHPAYDPSPDLANLTAQYAAAYHTGLVCDFVQPPTPFWKAMLQELDAACQAQLLPLWVPEAYAESAPHAWIMIGSDVTAGSFSQRLQKAAADYPERCILELRPLCAQYSLPSSQADRKDITRTDCEKLIEDHKASVYFAQDLLCSYFTFQGNASPQIVFFDSYSTIQEKIRAAESAGFRGCIGLMQELEGLLPTANV